jgi:hypothetical protein
MKMKKMFCFLLCVGLILSFAACSGTSTIDTKGSQGGDTETTAAATEAEPEATEAPTPPICETISGSRLLAAVALIDSDKFSYEVVLDLPEEDLAGLGSSASLKMYRDGDSFTFLLMGNQVVFVVDRKVLEVDHGAQTVYYTEMNELVYENFLNSWIDQGLTSTWVKLDGAEMIDSGTAEFMGEELFFEEIKDGNDSVIRAFFDDEDLIGLLLENVGGNKSEIPFRVSANIPEGVFDIPEDYEMIEN